MVWTPPKTWIADEVVGVSDMNTHVRDNLLSAGHLVKSFAFSSGEGNDVGGGDTQLTSYDVTLAAELLADAGNALLVDGTLLVGAVSEAKTCKLKVGGGTAITIYTATAASHIVPFRMVIRRRTSTAGSITGITFVGAAAAGAPTNYLVNAALGTVAWLGPQTLAIYLSGSTADSITLTDYCVTALTGEGATV